MDAAGAGGTFLRETMNELTDAGAGRQVRAVVGKDDIAGEVRNAADSLDVFVTPGEASGRADLLAMERGMTVSGVGDFSKKIAGRLQTRTGTISQTLEETIESVARRSEADAEAIGQGYAALQALNISNRFKTTVANDPILSQAWESMHKNKAYKGDLNTLPDNSAGQLDIFKQFLYEKAEKLKRSGNKKHAMRLDEFRTRMVQDLDTLVPEYGRARGLAQLNIVNKKMQLAVKQGRNRVRDVDGGYTTDVLDFFKKTMKSEQDYEDLMRGLSAVPEAQTKLTQIREILTAIEGSGINKVFRGPSERAGMRGTSGWGKGGAVALTGFDFLRGKNTDAVLDYITDPKYTSELLDTVTPTMMQKHTPEAMRILAKVFGRIGAGGITPEYSDDLPQE
jgi:hypothetical protein